MKSNWSMVTIGAYQEIINLIMSSLIYKKEKDMSKHEN